ncbi:MAG TPA: hypothetical protein VFN87_02835 [Solirubrobacteraceae bacterium]|nr:hypothetical protein [Solirubrobacteraceae bacterium]
MRISGVLRLARQRSAIHVELVVGALALWALSLPGTDVGAMTDIGLVSVLPAGYFVALAMVTVSFCLAVRAPQGRGLLLTAHLLLLIAMLHTTPAILYGTLRYAWAWKHVGIIDYIVRHGGVDLNISELTAYQDWPAFFSFMALIVKAAGFGSALAFASWAPAIDNLLFAGGVMFVVRSLTSDRRLAWLTVWIFCATNWVGQDYFSPQATNYFLYLVAIGICLRWLGPAETPSVATLRRWVRSERLARGLQDLMVRGRPVAQPSTMTRRAPAFAAIVMVIAAASVTSHQLTPFMLILSLGALVVFQLCAVRGLPVLIALMTAAWVFYMTIGFLKGNLYWIVASIGSLNIGSSTLSNLGSASPGHAFVAQISRLLTLLLGVLALGGLLRRRRHGHVELAAVLLAVAPSLMVWGNAYGGEVLFRIYFFALPSLAFLAAGLVFPARRFGRSWMSGVAAAGMCLALLAGMLIAYYGNERMYHISKDEVRSAQYLVTHAPRGSTLVGLTTDYPWGYRNYEYYTYLQISTLAPTDIRKLLADPVARTAGLVARASNGHEYVVFSRAQAADIEMTGGMPAHSPQRLEAALRASPRFAEVYRGPDAQIFKLLPAGGKR